MKKVTLKENEYNVDIKVLTSGEVDTYKKTLTFQIVDKK